LLLLLQQALALCVEFPFVLSFKKKRKKNERTQDKEAKKKPFSLRLSRVFIGCNIFAERKKEVFQTNLSDFFPQASKKVKGTLGQILR
jgi:hypothetical protein